MSSEGFDVTKILGHRFQSGPTGDQVWPADEVWKTHSLKGHLTLETSWNQAEKTMVPIWFFVIGDSLPFNQSRSCRNALGKNQLAWRWGCSFLLVSGRISWLGRRLLVMATLGGIWKQGLGVNHVEGFWRMPWGILNFNYNNHWISDITFKFGGPCHFWWSHVFDPDPSHKSVDWNALNGLAGDLWWPGNGIHRFVARHVLQMEIHWVAGYFFTAIKLRLWSSRPPLYVASAYLTIFSIFRGFTFRKSWTC